MSQILSDEAVILYEPIQTTFDVLIRGGSLTQQQDMIKLRFFISGIKSHESTALNNL
jgi:hypothetical protein